MECPDCEGKGRVKDCLVCSNERKIWCSSCERTGKRVYLIDQDGRKQRENCGTCEGRGYLPCTSCGSGNGRQVICRTCEGLGNISEEKRIELLKAREAEVAQRERREQERQREQEQKRQDQERQAEELKREASKAAEVTSSVHISVTPAAPQRGYFVLSKTGRRLRVVVPFLIAFIVYLIVLRRQGIYLTQILPHVLRVSGVRQSGYGFWTRTERGDPDYLKIGAADFIWSVDGSDYDLVMRKVNTINYSNDYGPDWHQFDANGAFIVHWKWEALNRDPTGDLFGSRPLAFVLGAHLVYAAWMLDGRSAEEAREHVLQSYLKRIPVPYQKYVLRHTGGNLAPRIPEWIGLGNLTIPGPRS